MLDDSSFSVCVCEREKTFHVIWLQQSCYLKWPNAHLYLISHPLIIHAIKIAIDV